MARSRNIKPAFFTNEILGQLDPIIGMTFVGLWCLADRDGRLEDRPLRIKAELFPYRESLDINGYLTVLELEGFLSRYEVDGVRYIEIINFVKHQTPHHTEKSKGYPRKPAPALDKRDLTVKEPLSNCENKVLERSDLLIPDSLNHERGKKKESPAKHFAAECPPDVDANVWLDWLALRKAKKAPVTETVINHARKESEEAGVSFEDFLKIWCARGSQGLEASWIKPKERQGSKAQSRQDVANFMFRNLKEDGDERPEVIDITPE